MVRSRAQKTRELSRSGWFNPSITCSASNTACGAIDCRKDVRGISKKLRHTISSEARLRRNIDVEPFRVSPFSRTELHMEIPQMQSEHDIFFVDSWTLDPQRTTITFETKVKWVVKVSGILTAVAGHG